MDSYQAFIGRVTSPICTHCDSGEEVAEYLLLTCLKWSTKRQHNYGECIDIKDVFRVYVIWWNSSSFWGIYLPIYAMTDRLVHDNNSRSVSQRKPLGIANVDLM